LIFDTDILIWVQRGHEGAASSVDEINERFISILTYMELLQTAHNKKQHVYIKDFLKRFGFLILPLTEAIGYRASIYVEEYSLSSGIRAGDALIAATATEHNMELLSANEKHYRAIKDLRLRTFKP
jgi:predicted nucleic acid-binding protein